MIHFQLKNYNRLLSYFFSLMLDCNSLLYRQLNINLQLLFFVFVVTRKRFQGQILILLQRYLPTKFFKLSCYTLSLCLFSSFLSRYRNIHKIYEKLTARLTRVQWGGQHDKSRSRSIYCYSVTKIG